MGQNPCFIRLKPSFFRKSVVSSPRFYRKSVFLISLGITYLPIYYIIMCIELKEAEGEGRIYLLPF